jgi:hypothetical protein
MSGMYVNRDHFSARTTLKVETTRQLIAFFHRNYICHIPKLKLITSSSSVLWHFEPLVQAAFAVVSTQSLHWASVVGYDPLSLSVILMDPYGLGLSYERSSVQTVGTLII